MNPPWRVTKVNSEAEWTSLQGCYSGRYRKSWEPSMGKMVCTFHLRVFMQMNSMLINFALLWDTWARLTWLMLPVQGHLVWLLWACVESCLPHRGLETDRQHLSPNRLFRDLSPVTCFFPWCPSSFVFTTFQILLFVLFWALPPSKPMSSCAMWIHTQWKIAGVRLCSCVSSRHVSVLAP